MFLSPAGSATTAGTHRSQINRPHPFVVDPVDRAHLLLIEHDAEMLAGGVEAGIRIDQSAVLQCEGSCHHDTYRSAALHSSRMLMAALLGRAVCARTDRSTSSIPLRPPAFVINGVCDQRRNCGLKLAERLHGAVCARPLSMVDVSVSEIVRFMQRVQRSDQIAGFSTTYVASQRLRHGEQAI
jgi:hypothetical protein